MYKYNIGDKVKCMFKLAEYELYEVLYLLEDEIGRLHHAALQLPDNGYKQDRLEYLKHKQERVAGLWDKFHEELKRQLGLEMVWTAKYIKANIRDRVIK